MLESFSVDNYRSIESTVLSLTYGKKRGRRDYSSLDYLPYIENGKVRLVPILVIYGANSSGKSTFLSALRTLREIVVNGHDGKYYHPDRYNREERVTTFSISFLIEEERWKYTLRYDTEGIREETIEKDGDTIFSGLPDGKTALTMDEGRKIRREIESILFFDPFSYTLPDSFSLYVKRSNKTRKECLGDVVSIVRKLDLRVDNIVDGEEWKTEHRGGKLFSLTDESEGTQRLFSLVSVMLASLSTGSLLLIDEIDVSLHPMVLRAVVSLFSDKRYNKLGAQLICSSHNTDLMDARYLGNDEIAVFEKTMKRGSVIERLSEIEPSPGLKSRRSLYLSGAYSGIPFPYV